MAEEFEESTRFARACSPFLDRIIERHPAWLERLHADGRLLGGAPPDPGTLAARIEAAGLDTGLRQFRNQEMMRIVWRELTRTASVEETLGDLSRLAECCLEAALAAHDEGLRARFGTPRDRDGEALSLVVLGLGKLGGGELNLSSDIDIVFAFSGAGSCDGRRALSAEQYFTRLARAVVNSLSEVTADGFCFRVDTRLRPFGESGPLTCSFGAMEQYYQREGRDWERYALVKARPVAGDLAAGRRLLETLEPFVYRRYIDFGAVEALHEMLGAIRADAQRSERGDDVKRGPGGIREIEFLVQCLQLLRGGREPALQTPRLAGALDAAERLGLFPRERIEQLRRDYGFLRRLENAIQALHDQQTHRLPGGEDLLRVSRAMRCDDEQALASALEAVRERVRTALLESFPGSGRDDDPGSSWPALLERRPALRGEAFDEFRAHLDRYALSQRASARLNRFMPMLIERLGDQAPSPDVQRDVLALVLAISRRSAYLALLEQNPPALDRMLDLFTRSDWIARTVIRYPALLDELIDPSLGRQMPGPEDVRQALRRTLRSDDPEQALTALNYAKRAQSLRIAVAELDRRSGDDPAEALLAELAEVLLDECLDLSLQLMAERHGRLGTPGLALIGYGSLGARDMNYRSDLDVVFLYPATGAESDGPRPLSEEQYYTRLTRRLLALTTTLSPSGRLYEVDTRLRPNGRSGLLVSSLSAFERYQHDSAWTWELQALARARPVAGDAEVGARFAAIRAEVLSAPRDPATITADVAEMRRRMREADGDRDRFKHVAGGLTDIDFVAQLGVLLCAAEAPEVMASTATRAQLRALAEAGWLAGREAELLADTHAALTRARHLDTLCRGGAADAPDTTASAKVCGRILGAGPRAAQEALE